MSNIYEIEFDQSDIEKISIKEESYFKSTNSYIDLYIESEDKSMILSLTKNQLCELYEKIEDFI